MCSIHTFCRKELYGETCGRGGCRTAKKIRICTNDRQSCHIKEHAFNARTHAHKHTHTLTLLARPAMSGPYQRVELSLVLFDRHLDTAAATHRYLIWRRSTRMAAGRLIPFRANSDIENRHAAAVKRVSRSTCRGHTRRCRRTVKHRSGRNGSISRLRHRHQPASKVASVSSNSDHHRARSQAPEQDGEDSRTDSRKPHSAANGCCRHARAPASSAAACSLAVCGCPRPPYRGIWWPTMTGVDR